MKPIFLTLCIVIGMCLSLNAQQRPIDWVHGLNADTQFWASERTLFEGERQINASASTNSDYRFYAGNNDGTKRGVVPFADLVRNRTNTGGVSLAIGHSMGGLAVREVIRQDALRYRGIVLCGSPLRGAKIMNSF
jgi:pimeloyl-ACP methyl ester carboxylesterase